MYWRAAAKTVAGTSGRLSWPVVDSFMEEVNMAWKIGEEAERMAR